MAIARYLIVGGLAAAALASGGVAQARDFVVLRGGDGGWTLIDRATIETGTGPALRSTWTVTVRRNILDNGPPEPGYVRTRTEYDCAQELVRWRQVQLFSQTGRAVVTQTNPSAAWMPAAMTPDGLVALRVVCGRSNGDSVVVADSIGAVVIALLRAFDPNPGALLAPSLPPALPAAPKAAAKPVAKSPAVKAPVAKPPAAKPPAAPAKSPKPPARKT